MGLPSPTASIFLPCITPFLHALSLELVALFGESGGLTLNSYSFEVKSRFAPILIGGRCWRADEAIIPAVSFPVISPFKVTYDPIAITNENAIHVENENHS